VFQAGVEPAWAKCAFERYELRLAVRDRYTLAPLANVAVTFFADDDSEAWPAAWNDTKPAHYLTDSAGKFSGIFHLSMDKGSFLGVFENCSRRLKRLTIFAARDGYYGERRTFKVAAVRPRREGDHVILELPALELQPAR
jgi:hypothetical protein